MIEILNLKHDKMSEPYDFRVDRASPVGNPFVMKGGLKDESTRDSVCDKYEEYFKIRVQEEKSDFLEYLAKMEQAVEEYGRLRLFCWCTPKRCHSETIKKWLLERRKTHEEKTSARSQEI